MARYLAIAMLALSAGAVGLTQAGEEKGKEKDFIFKGTFTKDDPRDQQRGGPSQLHTVAMKKGKAYTIDLMSTAVDSYLRLIDPKGNQLAEDDDGGVGLNSRIIFNCSMDGDYRIVATTLGGNAVGPYVLTVKMTGGAATLATAHARMLKEAAPDFEGDFAINGKAGSLSNLEGKVVVLHFWDIRASSSAALLPRLNEWSKTHKAKGLEVIGVTYYPSEVSQALGFDKEEGKVITVKKADRKSDRELFKAFAEHHKVGHTLMFLAKQDALDAFNAYYVNGLPQIVLIDRKGIVRMIEVGGEKTAPLVEAEITKLLAEK